MTSLYKLFASVMCPLPIGWRYGIMFLRSVWALSFSGSGVLKILPRSQFRTRLGNSYHERADVWAYPDTYRDPASGTYGTHPTADPFSLGKSSKISKLKRSKSILRFTVFSESACFSLRATVRSKPSPH